MIVTLASGRRQARKQHQCFHCYRDIPVGTVHGFQTNKYDYVYTIRWHLDCEDLANECRILAGEQFDDEGWGPLRDTWCGSGEYKNECDLWRGFYPHVVARMELSDQLRGEE